MLLSKPEQFYSAAGSGDLSLVQSLALDPSVPINWQEDDFRYSALNCACQENQLEVVRFLLTLPGIDVNLPQREGCTPLFIACQEGHWEIAQLLLADQRVDVNWPQHQGGTPLFLACQKGHAECVKLLLADPRVELNLSADIMASTPFLVACELGNTEVVKLLLADPRVDISLPNVDGATPFLLACENGHVDVVELLLADHRIDVARATEKGCTPLWFAAQNGHFPIVQLLLASGRHIDAGSRAHWNGTTAAEQARTQSERTEKEEEETEEHFLREREFGLPIAELIEAFEKDHVAVRAQLRKELGIQETWLESYLEVSLSTCTKVLPPDSQDPATVTALALSDSLLTEVPSKIVNFTELTEIDLTYNYLNSAGAESVATLLKSCTRLTHLSLEATNLTPADMLVILKALVSNYSQGKIALEAFEVDDMHLDSFDGLEMIPFEVLQQGSQEIIRYMLGLFRSPNATSLYRTKLLVLGFSDTGKTSLLDCLFPLTATLFTRVVKKNWFSKDEVRWSPCFVKLIGNNLTQSEAVQDPNSPSAPSSLTPASPLRSSPSISSLNLKDTDYFGTVFLNEKAGWSVEKIGNREIPGFKILGPEGFARELFCTDKQERDNWVKTIERALHHEHTHGIDMRQVNVISHPVVKAFFSSREQPKEGKARRSQQPKGKLEFSVWDFSGQPDYFQNHQHFLTTRSVFLVLWNLTEFKGEDSIQPRGHVSQGKGLQGLHFWFSSLAFHLDRESEGDFFKVIVVGTHFDQLSEKEQNQTALRQNLVTEISQSYELELANYLEVGCVNELENIGELQDLVFEEALHMKFMGERIPASYLKIEAFLEELQEQSMSYPIVDLSLFYERFLPADERSVRDALSLLSKWGKCVYFENDPRLCDKVILDPQFLSKTTLGGLFRWDEEAAGKRQNGIIHHRDLKVFWRDLEKQNDFWQVAELLISLMERFDVCFVLPEDEGKPFMEQRSLIPSLLPRMPNTRRISREIATLKRKKEGSKQAPSDDPEGLDKRKDELESQLSLSNPWKRLWPEDLPSHQSVQFERVFQFGTLPAELIARMVARLHRLIDGDCVVRDRVLLKKDSSTQAKVTVIEERDQFVIEIRAGTLEEGESLLSEIKETLSGVLTLFPHFTAPESTEGIHSDKQFVEGVRSPFSEKVIPLALIKSESGPSLEFEGEPALFLSRLKEMAGLVPPKVIAKKQIQEGSPEWTELALFLKLLGGDVTKVAAAFDIEDPEQRSMFEHNRKLIYDQHCLSPGIFLRRDHESMGNLELRRQYLHRLEDKYQEYEAIKIPSDEKDHQKTPVLPLAHATSEAIAWKISQDGFGIVSSLDDGYYGQGIYFTSQIVHALDSTLQHDSPVVVISLVNPGNTFPVTEHPFNSSQSLLGQTCKVGYQSHYCVTEKGEMPAETVKPDSTDELVVFERAQALPKYIVSFQK